MANAREIKRRMRSVKNTQQITKAMKMVSASKLRRAQGTVTAARPYKNKLKEVLSRLVASMGNAASDPLLEVRDVKRVGFVVFASKEEIHQAEERGVEIGIVAVGKKTREFFSKHGYTIDSEFLEVSDIPNSVDADAISKTIKSAYINGTYDEVHIVYSEFISAMSQVPTAVKVLPITTPESESAEGLDYIYEPSPGEVLSQILPLYLANQVFSALNEAKAGEHGARMTAMTSATDNASDLLAKLDLSYNRARQAAITNEITEIVGGVNALN